MICVRGTHLALGGPKTQLYAGLRSGVEANLHAVQAIWSQSAGWTADSGVVEEEKEDGKMQPCVMFAPRNCWIPMWTRARPRMIATPAPRQGPASVQLSLMPEMASTS
jgi:hypothetical protein